MTNKALVVLSGGQDSTTCLWWAKNYGMDGIHAVTFNYGQRHAIEIDAARAQAFLTGVASHEALDVGEHLLKSTSPLTSTNELEQYESFEQMDQIIGDRVEKTFVPMRNTLFLTIAANRAVALGCNVLITGICQADNANYPDCTERFRQHIEATINQGLGLTQGDSRYIHVVAPLMNLSKAESVKMAQGLPGGYEALAFSHTAYDGKFPPVGKDHASVLRAHGFEEAGVPDPLVVRAWMGNRMELPVTANYHDEQVIADLAVKINNLNRQLPDALRDWGLGA